MLLKQAITLLSTHRKH